MINGVVLWLGHLKSAWYFDLAAFLGNVLQFFGPIIALCVLLIRLVLPPFALGGPLRQGKKRERKAYESLGKPNIRAMSKILVRDLNRRDKTPADILAEWLCDGNILGRQGPAPTAPDWSDCDRAKNLIRLLRESAAPQSVSIWSRIFYAAESRAYTDRLSEIAELVNMFGRCEPVSRKRRDYLEDGANGDIAFRRFASAFSGAAVLLDTVHTRAHFAEQVLVWHSRKYWGGGARETSNKGNSDEKHQALKMGKYDESHASAHGCSLWSPEPEAGQKGYRAGDYDLRVLDLRAVSLAEATTGGYLSVALETHETCYATTEFKDFGCKKIPRLKSAEIELRGPIFTVGESAVHREPHSAQSRVLLVTSYVSLITVDNRVALVRRSLKVRNGPGVVSASAGGVVEPGDPGPRGDVNTLGMPDPIACAIREAREEIGLDLPTAAVSPVAVFIANIRDRKNNNTNEGEFDNPPPYADKGQLVAVVLSLARCPLRADEIESTYKNFSDPARGGFEVDQFQMFSFDERGKKGVSTLLAEQAYIHRDWLDQHGLLSLLYTAATIDGPDKARKAFVEKFPDAPWWKGETDVRVLVDPRSILPGEELEEAGPVTWTKAWDTAFPPSKGTEN